LYKLVPVHDQHLVISRSSFFSTPGKLGAGFRFPVPPHGKHLLPLLLDPLPLQATHLSPRTPLVSGDEEEDLGLTFFFGITGVPLHGAGDAWDDGN
jgi:hypothetical protein